MPHGTQARKDGQRRYARTSPRPISAPHSPHLEPFFATVSQTVSGSVTGQQISCASIAPSSKECAGERARLPPGCPLQPMILFSRSSFFLLELACLSSLLRSAFSLRVLPLLGRCCPSLVFDVVAPLAYGMAPLPPAAKALRKGCQSQHSCSTSPTAVLRESACTLSSPCPPQPAGECPRYLVP